MRITLFEPGRTRSVAIAAIVVLALGVVGVLAFRAVSGSDRTSGSQPQAGVGAPPAGCVAAPGTAQQDVDPRDSPEKPWQRPPEQQLTVYFTGDGLPDRYRAMLQTAAGIWSRSPCVEAVAASEVPGGANAVDVRTSRARPRSHTDGDFSGQDRGEYRTGGTITLYTNVLDRESDNGALATVVHEMGHAFGLVHRNNTADVMNANTNDQTNPVPDAVDFANLAALYGTGG